MRQLPERCETCGRQIATLETCVLPDGAERRGAEVTFGESAEGGIRCRGCAPVESSVPLVRNGVVVAEIPCEVERIQVEEKKPSEIPYLHVRVPPRTAPARGGKPPGRR